MTYFCLHFDDQEQQWIHDLGVCPFVVLTIPFTLCLQVLQHRLFILMTTKSNGGLITQETVHSWVSDHMRLNTMSCMDLVPWRYEQEGGYNPTEHGKLTEEDLTGWLVGKVWGVLKEAFAPQSNHPEWKVSSSVSA